MARLPRISSSYQHWNAREEPSQCTWEMFSVKKNVQMQNFCKAWVISFIPTIPCQQCTVKETKHRTVEKSWTRGSVLDKNELWKHYVFMFLSDKYSHYSELKWNEAPYNFVPVSCQNIGCQNLSSQVKKNFYNYTCIKAIQLSSRLENKKSVQQVVSRLSNQCVFARHLLFLDVAWFTLNKDENSHNNR